MLSAIRYFISATLLFCFSLASLACKPVPDADPALKISPEVTTAMSRANLGEKDLYKVMQIVSRYETGGCWAGATGSFDGQWVSLGIMQWNLGKGSLQPILKRYMSQFSTQAELDRKVGTHMPKYGKTFFDPSCRAIPIGNTCRTFLQSHYVGKDKELDPSLKGELDKLFESDEMRQLQIDYFARDLTKILDDLQRVFRSKEPAAWQVAWAMDLKTQQGRFPSDSAISSVRKKLDTDTGNARQERLAGVVLWYAGLCGTGFEDGVKLDCKYNVDTWNKQIGEKAVSRDREEAVHFTHIVSRTAQGKPDQGVEGAYQADAFQRRATIAFGKGSVHGYKLDFLGDQALKPLM